jgi:hypothetical protein
MKIFVKVIGFIHFSQDFLGNQKFILLLAAMLHLL